MSDHPYKSLPEKAFWRRSVAQTEASSVDPVGTFALSLNPDTKVATAGSCFAQNISRHLKSSGFNHFVAEPGHPLVPPDVREAHNYGLYSCRYGNIYTARQLRQVFDRAYGRFTPSDDLWLTDGGAVIDPFRPTIQPGGFVSEEEMRADRAQHLAAVRTMFKEVDVFVFTLGLTECWRSKIDGAVYPICPGVEGGQFDAGKYEFYNQPVGDVVEDLLAFFDGLTKSNRAASAVLTVSPVPLVATAEPGEHVLSATTYSKSVLRVAAEEVARQRKQVQYFPSYEIITGNFNRGAYYASDLRNVVEAGVSHVMDVFMRHAAGNRPMQRANIPKCAEVDFVARAEQLIEVECDEVALDRP
jgi:hypothetical protein